ncbi:hypothetical protein K505DRAFT_164056 [Melanomma pulvis-pyrius CBS 109.77]|uniref:Uncharacterized protein n=1 Tax=Melanomma pulvis-pyrius CBS 109.77 TaxID=1314802 RepID=A0A6A6WPB1_9PLEO|nr:hypothetical protein K505DRAFT_164056 [Melanomma pulvis-pyrius CBS 109.77]
MSSRRIGAERWAAFWDDSTFTMDGRMLDASSMSADMVYALVWNRFLFAYLSTDFCFCGSDVLGSCDLLFFTFIFFSFASLFGIRPGMDMATAFLI